MSTTRRTLLAVLASLPAASLPTIASVMSASPDAALIAEARRTAALAAMERRARVRHADAEERFDELVPARPTDCQVEISATHRAIMDACPTPVTLADNAMLVEFMRKAQAACAPIRAQHADCDRLRQALGLERADRMVEWLTDRLIAATGRLASTPVLTQAGLTAKAQAWMAIRAAGWRDCEVEWLDELAVSVGRDVIAMGGAA